ncbi:MAG: hypothetical protein JO225_12000, partial [Candidatus Eremiobacteraeota bacterium]|nr:hypothetical protein [Candidatus Eremiobacteraeota bacterium]
MSVDPLAGAAAGNADLAALVDAELAQLAADAQALRALLVEDAVVTARVLPSNGLTDLLEIAGRRVAASLPPNVRPGDVLQVRVTGFDGERILLQIVGTGADAAVESGPPNLPVAPPPGAFVPSTIQPAPGTPAPYAPTPGTPYPTPASSPYPAPGQTPYPAPSNTPAGSSGAVPTRGGAPSGATPAAPNASAQFAGAVLRANVTSTSGTGGDASAAVAAAREALAAATERLIPSPGSAGTANTTANPVTEAPATGATATNANAEATPNGAGSAAAAAHSPDAVTTQRPGASAGPPTSIEARLAAARASIANATANSTRGTFAPNAPSASRSAAPPPPQSSFVAPPQIEPKTAVGLDAAVRRTAQPEFITSRSAWPSAPPTQPASSEPAQTVSRTSGLAAYAEPVALLRALRLPVTPSNVSAATLALQRPDKLPSALAALERALPRASDDPHIATLRTLLPFVGRIDPASPRLAAQIAAYVDHVV